MALGWFVTTGWREEDDATALPAWPHAGFGAHVGQVIAGEDRAGRLRVARDSARAPTPRAGVKLVSDANEGPYEGVHQSAALQFLAQLVDHIPGKGEVMVRDDGAYASRRRGW